MNLKPQFVALVILLTSCISANERDVSIATDGEAEITVSEAREFFEQEMLTRNDDTPSPNVLSPGDFTPRWDDAKISQNHRIACVDVPIIPKFAYRAIRSEYRLGKATAYIVKVSQKLVIIKDRESGDMTHYIMSLIPEKAFAAKHKGDISDSFLNAGDRGNYSGIVLYTHNDIPVTVNRYIDGVYSGGATTCDIKDQEQANKNYRKIINTFSNFKFKRISGIGSRSGEDGDEGDDDWWQIGDIEPPLDYDDPIIDEVPDVGDGGSDNADQLATVKNYMTAIMKGLGDKVAIIKRTCRFGTKVNIPNMKACVEIPKNGLYSQYSDTACSVIIGLNEVQTSLATAHACMHLALLEISKNTGSAAELNIRNHTLYELIKDYDINRGHHEYMAEHIEEMKQLLRDVFPNQSEEYYEYGVWGYGLTETGAFEKLPSETKNKIDFYIRKNSL